MKDRAARASMVGLKIKDTSWKDEMKKDRENASGDSRRPDMRKEVRPTF